MARKRDVPFLERVRTDRKTGQLVEELTLRERFPDYVKAFSLGLAVVTIVGLVASMVTNAEFGLAVGYTWVFTGTILLLSGGARGGGYSNLSIGAFEAVIGGRNRADDDYESADQLRRGKVMQRRDPMARLRKGLRPPPNPTAFWQIIAGMIYIGLGLPLTF